MLSYRLPTLRRLRPPEWRALVVCGGIAAGIALLLALVIPAGGDAAAHLYRTLLVKQGAFLWDNLWYAGQYPLASYALFYYLPAALIGNVFLAAVGVLLSALMYGSMVLRVWGPAARWSAYAFAAVVGGQFFTGDYPYTLAFTALLGTLWALQRGRTWLAVVCAALTLGCSPLAFLFLCLTLFALVWRFPPPRPHLVVIAVTLGVLAAIQLGALALFPSRSLVYPFGAWRLVLGLGIGALGISLALRSRAARPLLNIFVVWTAATFVGYFISSPIGHNFLRPAAVVFPLMLLTAKLADFRPRWLSTVALAAAFAVNVFPYATTVISRTDPAAKASFWAPLLGYLERHPAPSFRLEVVATQNHWEAYYVPKAGFAIARGWYQQLDKGDNPALYANVLTPAHYRAWLRSVGVRYVVLPRDIHAAEAQREAHLLVSGRSGLVRVFESPSGSIFELPHATPILTGPAPAAITSQSHSRINGWVERPGSYLLRVHYTLLWRAPRGSLCLARAPNDMTRLDLRRAGDFSLRAGEGVTALVGVVTNDDASTDLACPAGRPAPGHGPPRLTLR